MYEVEFEIFCPFSFRALLSDVYSNVIGWLKIIIELFLLLQFFLKVAQSTQGHIPQNVSRLCGI